MNMTDMRIENGLFLYRDQPYPCGSEYMLYHSGTDSKGRRTFTEIKVWDGKVPYNEREDFHPVEGAFAPKGYVWYANKESRFSGRRKTVLLRISARKG